MFRFLLPRNPIPIIILYYFVSNIGLFAQSSLRLEYMGRVGTEGTTSLGYAPLGIDHCGDDRLFVVRQRGYVEIIFPDGSLYPQPFLDIESKVFHNDDRGLLGMCFHPDYKNNRYFYVTYTRAGDGEVVIARFQTDSLNPNHCHPATEKIFLQVGQPIGNHNGGSLAFGPDGYLYIGMGDGGCCGDPHDLARKLEIPLGKIVRIDVDHEGETTPFRIPADNPYASRQDDGSLVWAYGLRNPWRFSFDRQTHDFWIADVGQDIWEEINMQPARSKGGQFYGWSAYEADQIFNAERIDSTITHVGPLFAYPHVAGWGQCIVGGYVYRGWRFPKFKGYYIFNDFSLGTFMMLQRRDTGIAVDRVELDIKRENRFACIGQDRYGELYTADIQTGRVYRIVDSTCQSVELTLQLSDSVVALNGPMIALNANPPGGTFSGNGVIDSLFYPELAGMGEHSITYHYVNNDGCGSRSTTWLRVTEPIVSVAHGTVTVSKLYPNPASRVLHFSCTNASHIRIVNALGQVVHEFDAPAGSSTLSLQTIPDGHYYLCDNQSIRTFIVLQH